jgi:two-component sensor histidine kinase
MGPAPDKDRANILLVDDQPGKLASYEVILSPLGENLLKASSAKEALELLLKNDIAVLLVDVVMPELDGFELAQMIREHPRYKDTAIIFISAVALSDEEWLRAYELGAVDFVPVPVVPGILRAKVSVFVDLYRKTKALARVNGELEKRVAERTAELQTAIAQQELLAREVDHRARNALAVIQSIVAMMPAAPAEAFSRAVEGRIRAMARAHTLLSHSRWEGADLYRLVHEELEPYGPAERFEIEGPAVSIRPTVAQNFALAIHELATNAAKYGALSAPGGRLRVSWALGPDGLRLEWAERCDWPVSAPQSRGFGSKVIEASIQRQLGGAFSADWSSGAGLIVRMAVPADHFAGHAPASPAPARQHEALAPVASRPRRSLNRRILLVEDEPIIGMMMQEMLRRLGAEVLGPYTSAVELERSGRLLADAAVLDVNLGGELVYPIAEKLAREGVPFVFLTGYEAGGIDPRFADAPILTKPVDEGELAEALNGLLLVQDVPLPVAAQA